MTLKSESSKCKKQTTCQLSTHTQKNKNKNQTNPVGPKCISVQNVPNFLPKDTPKKLLVLIKTDFIKPNIVKKNANVDARVIQVKNVQQKQFALYFQSK